MSKLSKLPKPENEIKFTFNKPLLFVVCLLLFILLFSPIVSLILSAGKGQIIFGSEPSPYNNHMFMEMNLQDSIDQDSNSISLNRVAAYMVISETYSIPISYMQTPEFKSFAEGQCAQLLYLSDFPIDLLQKSLQSK